MDLFRKKHNTGKPYAKPGTAATGRREASRKKQRSDKVEQRRASNIAPKRKATSSPPSSPAKDFTDTQKKVQMIMQGVWPSSQRPTGPACHRALPVRSSPPTEGHNPQCPKHSVAL